MNPFEGVDLTPPAFHVGLLIRYEGYDVTFLTYSLCLLSQMLYVVSLVLFASPFLFFVSVCIMFCCNPLVFLQPVEDDLKIYKSAHLFALISWKDDRHLRAITIWFD